MIFIFNKRIQNLADLYYENEKIIENQIDFKLNWVYGINIEPIKYPIRFLLGQNSFNIYDGNFEKKQNKFSKNFSIPEIIVYSIGKIIVIYNYSILKQKYYLSHEV